MSAGRQPSAAIQQLPRSGIRVVFDEASQYPDCIRLEVGEPSFPTPAHIKQAAADAMAADFTRYTPNAGIADLRDALVDKLARRNGITAAPDDIIVTNGAVASLGLSDATGWALLQVHRSGTEVSQARLAAALDISAPSLVRLLAQLEQRRLIRREADAADRRPNRISLTPEGKITAERIEDRLVPVRAALFRDFSDDDLSLLAMLLARFEERLQAEPEPQA